MNQSAGLQGAGLNQQGQMANQNAGLQASQLQLGAASALSGLSQQELNMALQKAGAMESAGAAQQGQEQAQIDAQYQQWLQEWMYPLQQQQIRNESLGLFPVTGTTKSSGTSSTKQSMGLGGILSAAGSLAGGAAMLSDETAKEGIETVRIDGNGIRWVNFRYKGQPETHFGVIAQEVEKIKPEAVIDGLMGYKIVNYAKLEAA